MPDLLQLDSLPEYVRAAISAQRGRIMCPKCDGGRSSEESLSVRQVDGGVLTKLSCWRASCSWYAYVGTAGVKLETKAVKPANVYRDPLSMLDDAMLTRLGVDYGLKPVIMFTHGWRQAENTTTLVMPIRDAYGRERGHLTRTFDTPKRCYTFKATSLPWLDWWLVDEHAPVVVVEDTLSACRLAGCGLNAVALLGTSMTTEQAQEIAEVADVRPIHLALDNDAFGKAIGMHARHAHILGIVGIHCLPMDVKNFESDDDIQEMFGGRIETDSSNDREAQST